VLPRVDDDRHIGSAELRVHDAVDERIDARTGPERQRSQHVDVAVQAGALVGQVDDGERQIGEHEREEHGQYHVQRVRPMAVMTAAACRGCPPARDLATVDRRRQ